MMNEMITDTCTTIARNLQSDKGVSLGKLISKLLIASGTTWGNEKFSRPMMFVFGEMVRHGGSLACKLVEAVQEEYRTIGSNQALKDAWEEAQDAVLDMDEDVNETIEELNDAISNLTC